MNPGQREYIQARVANLKSQVSIYQVLLHYQIPTLRSGMEGREVQYPCPLHGDGQDNSYSARVYPESGDTYCFACQKTRDIISWTQDKKSVPFMDAVRFLEDLFEVQNIPRPTHNFSPKAKTSFVDDIKRLTSKEVPKRKAIEWEVFEEQMCDMLKIHKSVFTYQEVIRLWKVFDHVYYKAMYEGLSEEKSLEVLKKITLKIMEKIRDAKNSGRG